MTTISRGWAVLLAATLTACTAPAHPGAPRHQPIPGQAGQPATPPAPSGPMAPVVAPDLPADGQAYGPEGSYRLLAVEELPIVGVGADGAASGFPAARLADGDLATQWASGGYRPATAWAAVALAGPAAIARIAIKTGPMPAGTRYDVQVSDDGAAWTTALADQANSTWGLEARALPAGTRGRHVRIFWRNGGATPQARFAIYELEVHGEPGVAPTPAPSATPTPGATPTPAPSTIPSTSPSAAPAQRLPRPASVSTGPSYAGLSPLRAIDGDLGTQWSNGEYQAAQVPYQLNWGEAFTFTQVRLKTGALPAGVGFRFEVSDDGATWRAASGALTNATWNLEAKAVAGTGRHLRVVFQNRATNPLARFSLYELEAWGRPAGGNRPPVITAADQRDFLVDVETGGDLFATATDPDGDPLTYAWTVHDRGAGLAEGSITGAGAEVRYQPFDQGPTSPDDTVTVRVSDGRGGVAERTFATRVYYGSTFPLRADQAVEWSPAKAASASFDGDVTASASGTFDGYAAVIAEYTTASGRKLALIDGDPQVLPGVKGAVYLYLLGPTGTGFYDGRGSEEDPAVRPLIPQPTITVALTGPGGTTTRTITQANVVASHHAGTKIDVGSRGPLYHLGENSARNGARPYDQALLVHATSAYEDGPGRFVLRIGYGLRTQGQTFYAPPVEDYDDMRLLLTDSAGGLGDNTGAWTIYEESIW